MNKVYSVLLCCLFVCLGCSDKSARYHLPTAPDYTQENAWYIIYAFHRYTRNSACLSSTPA